MKKTPGRKKEKLTLKQVMFINEYMVDMNATQACIRSGYAEKAAGQMGDENLKKPQIAEEIRKRMDERARRLGITADNVLADIDAIRRIKKISPKDRLRALELLAKHLKLITERHEIDGQIVVKEMGRVKINGKPLELKVGNAVRA